MKKKFYDYEKISTYKEMRCGFNYAKQIAKNDFGNIFKIFFEN